MSDSNADSPVTSQPLSGTDLGFTDDEFGVEMVPPVGWVVHLVAGRPQSVGGRDVWAWCKVSPDEPGYSEVVFTETDGSTPADPYPKPVADAPEPRLQLGAVVFKVFC